MTPKRLRLNPLPSPNGPELPGSIVTSTVTKEVHCTRCGSEVPRSYSVCLRCYYEGKRRCTNCRRYDGKPLEERLWTVKGSLPGICPLFKDEGWIARSEEQLKG